MYVDGENPIYTNSPVRPPSYFFLRAYLNEAAFEHLECHRPAGGPTWREV